MHSPSRGSLNSFGVFILTSLTDVPLIVGGILARRKKNKIVGIKII